MDDDRFIVISSDGHVGALMADYREYLDVDYLDEFDEFLISWNDHGSRNIDEPALRNRLDPQFFKEWTRKMVDTGRIDHFPDPDARLKELDREGVSAEVLFPEFGLPFELYNPSLAAALGHPPLDEEHRRASFRAFNRWLSDFVSVAPERFAGMAIVSWADPEVAVREIGSAHETGLKGIVLPEFATDMPLYHERFEPIWNTLDELGMVVNSHLALSSTRNQLSYAPGVPHPACGLRVRKPESEFFCHNILSHLIWGGVLERHPDLKFVFTEQGSSWVVPALADMDYSYDGSYGRSDFKDVIRLRPSEYFKRQCYLGSSLLSLAEVNARREIGIDKMMVGMDFPHHEGMLLETTEEYLRATLGAAHVPFSEARLLLTDNAAKVFEFDLGQLAPVAARIGLSSSKVLSPPDADRFPRGDVHKPATLTL